MKCFGLSASAHPPNEVWRGASPPAGRAVLLLALAAAVVLPLRAAAQEDDDDLDKIPVPTSRHVVHSGGSELPDDSLGDRPAAAPTPAPHPTPAPAPVEKPRSPQAGETEARPPRADEEPPPRAEPDRHSRKRKKKEKKSRHGKRGRKHRGRSTADDAEGAEATPERPVSHGTGSDLNDGENPASAEKAHPALPGEGEARQPSSGGSDMDFDFLPKQKQVTAADAADVAKAIKVRRKMLEIHQGFGIATAALMAATVVTGQLNYSNRFGGGGSSGQFELWHSGLEAATTVSFATAGLLAILAPVPFERHSEGIDTVTVHKWSMLVATIGMLSEVPLGIYTVSREGYVNQGTMALTHLIIGYVTAAALGTGATALFF